LKRVSQDDQVGNDRFGRGVDEALDLPGVPRKFRQPARVYTPSIDVLEGKAKRS
jgi:hypothetical protein